MNVELEVNLADEPGQLMKVLDPISVRGGNLIGIYHFRDRIKEKMIPVVIQFEIGDMDNLNKIKSIIEASGIEITRLESEKGIYETSFILIGHVYNSNIKDTLDRLMKDYIVRSVSSKIKDKSTVSTVKISVLLEKKEMIYDLYELIDKICNEKKLISIKQLDIGEVY
ncbi:MAG: hypothetical protein EAX96_12650 [Candidatus Lokiarchaeota archaeon]|nr:hypothetical protein [Candidatus Lokiarchaeota archaeon]